MAIVVRKTGGDFVPAPAGTWPAVCVDVVDLGEIFSDWKQEKVHKIRLVWQISERMADGRPYVVAKQYTASLHEKSNLRKDLSSWRGQDFKPEELNGFDLENVLGVGCLLSVVQQAGNDGQMYGNVIAVMRLPGGYEAPRPDGYVRTIHREGQDAMASAPRSSPGFQPQPPRAPGQFGRRQGPVFQRPAQGQPLQPLPPPQPGAQYTDEVTEDDVPF